MNRVFPGAKSCLVQLLKVCWIDDLFHIPEQCLLWQTADIVPSLLRPGFSGHTKGSNSAATALICLVKCTAVQWLLLSVQCNVLQCRHCFYLFSAMYCSAVIAFICSVQCTAVQRNKACFIADWLLDNEWVALRYSHGTRAVEHGTLQSTVLIYTAVHCTALCYTAPAVTLHCSLIQNVLVTLSLASLLQQFW